MVQDVVVVSQVWRVSSLPIAMAVYMLTSLELPLHCTAMELSLQSRAAFTFSGRHGAARKDFMKAYVLTTDNGAAD